ncbi:MAG: hypothetical protein APR54_02960 [Candidatus Cloacimonas sp. SDB]|nr:MAG: hypothetical protein APR54_02960 [Candidatus Cloacimonas sp. SDB]
MKNKILILLISLTLLLFLACDRFEHSFEPAGNNENSISAFFNEFADTLTTFPNIPGIMSFYHEDYSNNGQTKADVEDFYTAFTLLNCVVFLEASLSDTSNYNITWQLLATTAAEEVILDTTFTDVLIPAADSYLFYGNQTEMRNVVIELFSGQWCSNCPTAEAAIYNLKQQYGSRLSYTEYHIADQLATDENNAVFAYYPNTGSLPFAVINGNALLLYAAPSVESVQAEIENAITPLLAESPVVNISDFQYSFSETELNGSVQIELEGDIPTDNLNLVAVLVENYNADYLNHNGEPHHNIVLKRINQELNIENLEEPVEFDITGLDALAPWYDELPADLKLVIWIQTITPSYNEQTCTVYNVIEISLE